MKRLFVTLLLFITCIMVEAQTFGDYFRFSKLSTADKLAVDVNDSSVAYVVYDTDLQKLQINYGLGWTDVSADLSNYVPYTGGTGNIDLVGNQWLRIRESAGDNTYAELGAEYLKIRDFYTDEHYTEYREGNIIFDGLNSQINLDGNWLATQGSHTVRLPYNTNTLVSQITDGTSVVTANQFGLVDISSLVASGGGGIQNIEEDLTPTLGGDLDIDNNNIISNTSAYISIDHDENGTNQTFKILNGTDGYGIFVVNQDGGVYSPNTDMGDIDALGAKAFINKEYGDAKYLSVTNTAISSNYTLLPTDEFIEADNTSNTFTITVDASSMAGLTADKIYTFTFKGSNTVTVDFNGVTGTDFVTYANTRAVTVQYIHSTTSFEVINEPIEYRDSHVLTTYNQASEPSLTSTPIPNTAAFVANVDMALNTISIDGTEYHFWLQLSN